MILVTGGAGYIGSHMCVALAQANEPFLVLDNFGNSRPSVLERIGRITGREPECVRGDVRDAGLAALSSTSGGAAIVRFSGKPGILGS